MEQPDTWEFVTFGENEKVPSSYEGFATSS